jgi:hypothetical protein
MKTLQLDGENTYPLNISSNATGCWSAILLVLSLFGNVSPSAMKTQVKMKLHFSWGNRALQRSAISFTLRSFRKQYPYPLGRRLDEFHNHSRHNALHTDSS